MPCSNDVLIFVCQAKRSSVKLEIYRKFSNALAVTVVASVVWIGYEVCAFGLCIPFLLFNASQSLSISDSYKIYACLEKFISCSRVPPTPLS